MEPDIASPKPAKPAGGMPYWTALVALLILALVGLASLGAVWYFTRSDKTIIDGKIRKLDEQQARATLAEKNAAQNGKMAVARSRQQDVLAHARNATNSLTLLLQEAQRLASQADALKSNDAGRRVAVHPDLVAQARRFYENDLADLPSTNEILGKLESAQRVERQLVSALGTTYEPTTDLLVIAQNAALWAEQQARAVAQAQTLLTSLIQESQIKVTDTPLTTNSPTLAVAIQELNQAEAAFRQRAILEKTSLATTQAVDTVAQATALRILTEARIQASNILAQANEAKAMQEREELKRQADSKIEDSKARVKASQKEDEARRIEQRKRAADPDVQVKLAPFITPGYWRPKSVSYDKKAHSLTQLQSFGALDDTIAGLRKLADIACNPRDQARPRWKLPQYWVKNPQEMEKVKAAQQLLVELGPVLVELKMLEP